MSSLTTSEVVLVAAVAANGVIGADGGMPWHLPEDLRRFKALTMGHPMVMGRKTFEAIGRPLPGRRTIVVTRDRSWRHEGVESALDLGAALELAATDGVPIAVVGGGQIYTQAMPVATRLEVTHIDAAPDGDTFFPAIDPATWRESAHEQRDGYSFVTYVRRDGGQPDSAQVGVAGGSRARSSAQSG
ncbi:dihydrofolate reductase [Kineosphaera limosa]|nr:dihydrofolate reductase [Kineosphaera limosa]NYE02838.1 dihydrofolate reductase [Kineosphaera limosa]